MVTEIKCLNAGHVKLVDKMGDDAAIVAAARNSISGLNVKATSDDRGLIRFLMRHHHSTPFEAAVLTFEMKIPIFVARQLVRHRTQSLNELSARYSELPEEYYVPLPENIQMQADKNKQGRKEEVLAHAEGHQQIFAQEAHGQFVQYKMRLNDGMARELARINLPLSTYTQWWSTMNLHNVFHMLGLRKDAHAQYETRVFADAIGEIVKQLFPFAWEAFEDFRLNAITLSAQEVQAIAWLLNEENAMCDGTEKVLMDLFKTKREHSEFVDKLARIQARYPS